MTGGVLCYRLLRVMKIKTAYIFSSVVLALAAPQAMGHCQVPCGIYADDNVFVGMEKDVETIQKAMEQIKGGKLDVNQQVRWVNNKESHAQSLQDTVAKYFLAQRIKVTEAEKSPKTYANKLALLHQITVYAMKCKQTTDVENAKKLAKALADFKAAYKAK